VRKTVGWNRLFDLAGRRRDIDTGQYRKTDADDQQHGDNYDNNKFHIDLLRGRLDCQSQTAL
jgi:hypothetical protein